MERRSGAGGQGQPPPAARAGHLRVLFAGTPQAAVPSLQALLASPRHDVAAVLTRPDAPAGRGRRTVRSPVALAADAAGVPVHQPPTLRGPQAQQVLAGIAPDCCAVVAYGALVPPALLDLPRYGWVNLHFSLLPAWRGAAPVQRALLAGDEITGACTFLLEAGLDTGPVLGTLTERIDPTDTSGTLLERLAVHGARLLAQTLDGLQDGRLQPVPQPTDGVSLAPKLEVTEARVDWHAPALRVDRLVRATTPDPGAWSTLRGQRVKLGPVALLDETGTAPPLLPGRLLAGPRGRVLAGTATRPVQLGWVRPAGRSDMPAADWVRGLHLQPGEGFE